MLKAERQFRRIIDRRHLAKLALAVERDLQRSRAAVNVHTPSVPTDETATLATI
jgi:hypothetical protein